MSSNSSCPGGLGGKTLNIYEQLVNLIPIKFKVLQIHCKNCSTIGKDTSELVGSNVVVVFVFNIPPTAKVIWRRDHGLK